MGVQNIITDASVQLPTDKAILLFLTVVLEDQNAPYVLQFLHPDQYRELDKFLQDLMPMPSHDRRFPLLDAIQTLVRKPELCGLDEIDGSWLLHLLKKEKPSVIGLILKHLPADKVYQILNLMDPELRSKLPDTETLDQVPDELIQIVRERFGKNLLRLPKPAPMKQVNFQVLRNLKNYELFSLVRDLGLDLISLAFQGVNERSLIELVKNLDEGDAEILFEKFNFYRKANRGEIKNAQLELLGLSLDFSNGTELVLEAGIQRLARSLIKVDDQMIEILQYRLPLKSGYQLRRYVDDFRSGNFETLSDLQMEKTAKKIQAFIVQRMRELSREGQIDLPGARPPGVQPRMH